MHVSTDPVLFTPIGPMSRTFLSIPASRGDGLEMTQREVEIVTLDFNSSVGFRAVMKPRDHDLVGRNRAFGLKVRKDQLAIHQAFGVRIMVPPPQRSKSGHWTWMIDGDLLDTFDAKLHIAVYVMEPEAQLEMVHFDRPFSRTIRSVLVPHENADLFRGAMACI